MYTTYSFLDLNAVLSNPLVGSIPFGGEGLGEVTISMGTEKTEMSVASDGTVMGSVIAGDNGTVSITVQRTSQLHTQLLNLYNLLKIQMPLNWLDTAMYSGM